MKQINDVIHDQVIFMKNFVSNGKTYIRIHNINSLMEPDIIVDWKTDTDFSDWTLHVNSKPTSMNIVEA